MTTSIRNYNGYKIVQYLNNKLIPDVRESLAAIRRSRFFTTKEEQLQVNTLTTESDDLCSGLKESLAAHAFQPQTTSDNELSYNNLKKLVDVVLSPISTLRTLLNELHVLLRDKYSVLQGQLDQMEEYRFDNQIQVMQNHYTMITKVQQYIELIKTLTKHTYDNTLDYDFSNLQLDVIQEYIEKKDADRLKQSSSLVDAWRKKITESKPSGRESGVEIKVSTTTGRANREQATQLLTQAKLYCGPESPHNILPSYNDYIRQMRKLYRRRIEGLKHYSILLPECIGALRKFTLKRIISELEKKNAGFIIDAEGDKIVPYDFITYEFYEVWDEMVGEVFVDRFVLDKQVKMIAEAINFEVVKLKASARSLLSGNENDKIRIIRSRFPDEEIELYDALLPQRLTVEKLIKQSLEQL